MCNCSGKSKKCFFDQELFEKTGHGGHWMNCEGSTTGVNCEKCLENFYRQNANDDCLPCECNIIGSLSQQCDITGACKCKLGVTGSKCDQCINSYYGLNFDGCRPCNCSSHGSLSKSCDPVDGSCVCKKNIEGRICDRYCFKLKNFKIFLIFTFKDVNRDFTI